MPGPDAFQYTARGWHDFYLLTGGAAATLTGLMFVAVTFGAGLVSADSAASPRAFIDPTLSHFVQVLITAGLLVAPTMTAHIAGVLILAAMIGRSGGLVWVYRHLRRAHRAHGDIELADWLMSILLPAIAFATVGTGALGFLLDWNLTLAFNIVAAGTGAVLAIGIRSAWELMIWMATAMARKKTKE